MEESILLSEQLLKKRDGESDPEKRKKLESKAFVEHLKARKLYPIYSGLLNFHRREVGLQ